MTTYNYLLDTGVIVEDTSTVLTDVQGEWQTALGANINVDAATPQGTLITADTLARTNVMRQNAELANNFNPNLSQGTFLDAMCALLGITRGVNQSTVATGVTFTGNGVTAVGPIPAGSRVQTANGDIFVTTAPVTIPSSGSITTVALQSQASGAIPLPVGTLTILDGYVGWASASITGGTVVTLGTLAYTDGQLRNMRLQQLAMQGIGSSAAIQAAVLAVNGVTSCKVIENNTGATGAVQGVTFTKANAMWVCVAGTFSNAALAAALYGAHNGGCPWDFGSAGMGNQLTGLQATDPATGMTYAVLATTPILYDGYVQISVHQNNNVASPASAVQNAIVAYATGQEDGEVGLTVGASLSAYEIAGAVARQLPGMYVKSCSVATVTHGSAAPSGGAYVQEVVVQPYQQVLLPSGNIIVTLV